MRESLAWVAALAAVTGTTACTPLVSLDSPNWPSSGAGVATAPPPQRSATNAASVVVTPVAVPSAVGGMGAPWVGHYAGVLPCADCSGVRTVLSLNDDGTYMLSMNYEGRSDALPRMMRGNFTWNADETIVILDAAADARRYEVGNGWVRQLDAQGNPVAGVLAESYVLRKR